VSAVRDALKITLLTRGALFLIGFLAVASFDHAPGMAVDRNHELGLLADRWDASWYLGIASGGYRWNPEERNPRVAFFPGYPLTVRAVGRVLRLPDEEVPWLWTGVALSVVYFLLALIWLQRLAIDYGATPPQASHAAWLLAAYPFSLFYGQFYSESLFLLCAVVACHAARRRQWLVAALFGLGVGLVRPTGVLVSLMLAWTAFEQFRADRERFQREWWIAALAMAAPALGIALYAAYMHAVTGDALAWMHAQVIWGRTPAPPWTPFVQLFDASRAHGVVRAIFAQPYDALNAAAALFALAAVVPVGRRLGWGAGAFVLVSLLLPLGAGGLLSVGRFTSVLFPIFLWLAVARRSVAGPGLVAVFAMLQGLLAAMFFTDRGLF
jgi:hypothetical protein